jgi:hypothetical protein
MKCHTLSSPRKNTIIIGMYIKPSSNADKATNFFLEPNQRVSFGERSCETEPIDFGSASRRPSCMTDAWRNTAKAPKKDSPKPTIAE